MRRLFDQLSTDTLASRMGWVALLACVVFMYLAFFRSC